MNLVCENIIGLEVGRTSLNSLKMKIKDLLDEVEEMDSMGGGYSVMQYLTEMVEENKILSTKCRELAHLVKNLKRERRECLIVSKRELESKQQSELLDQYERERLELHEEVEFLRKELFETQNIVQLLTAQVMTYKEDFEMERRDRERAMEKINLLEGRLLEEDQVHAHIQRHNASSSHDFETTNNHHHHHQARHERDCEHAELIPRSFGGLGQAPRTEGSVSSFSVISSHGDKAGDDKLVLNPHKRKLNHADSFDKVSCGKLPSLE